MAALVATCRTSVRAVAQHWPKPTSARGFCGGVPRWAAANFAMPAMSPTMTEGNISSWKVKEGESYAAGDVLLEIETDKATMDVEAQDNGIMAKIMEKDGAKGVKVGARIAVTAEPSDDLSSLQIPEDSGSAAKSAPKKQSKTKQEPNSNNDTQTKASLTNDQSPSSPKPASQSPDRAQSQKSSSSSSSPSFSSSPSGKPMSSKYPLYPSVEHLLHVNGISKDVYSQIPATGPSGRLLKGDVLAHLGQIECSYTAAQASRITELSHLDLSNIKKAAPPAKPSAAAKAGPAPKPEAPTQVAVHVSLAAVLATQKRLRDALGLDLPLSAFIARASALANENLPTAGPPSADALFDAVLGLDRIPGGARAKKGSSGHYTPQVTALPPMVVTARTPAASVARGRVDILDVLTGVKTRARTTGPGAMTSAGVGGNNVFSVSVRKGEERRVRTYLERMKTVLEKEPARLVL